MKYSSNVIMSSETEKNMKSKSQTRPPSSLACVVCRRRHLKCDARMPICSRCQASQTECRYVQSRRGLRSRNSKGLLEVAGSSMTYSDEAVDDGLLLAATEITEFPDWLQTDFEVWQPSK